MAGVVKTSNALCRASCMLVWSPGVGFSLLAMQMVMRGACCKETCINWNCGRCVEQGACPNNRLHKSDKCGGNHRSINC